MRLKGKKAIVTGAGGGIGRAVCLAFAKEGAELICADVDESRSLTTVSQVEAEGGKAFSVTGDMADELHTRSLVDAAEKELGGLTSIVSCCGLSWSCS